MLRSATQAVLISSGLVILLLLSAFWMLSPSRARRGGPAFEEPSTGPLPATEPSSAALPVTRADATGRLSIVVVDAATGRGIPSAHVLIERGTFAAPLTSVGEIVLSIRGDAQRELPHGSYILEARSSYHRKERREVLIEAGTELHSRFELVPGLAISGRVLTRGGDPIAGASVAAVSELRGLSSGRGPGSGIEELVEPLARLDRGRSVDAVAATSLDGTFQLDGLGAETYRLRATAKGWAPGELRSVPAPREGVELRLDPGREVLVHAVDEDRGPVPRAKIRAFFEEETAGLLEKIFSKALPPIAEVETDAKGVARFETLGRGLYSFMADAPGRQRAQTSELRLPTKARIELVLQQGAVLRGVVLGPDSEVVVGAQVRVTPRESGGAVRQERLGDFGDELHATSDESGGFEIDGLGAGPHLLTCSHRLYATLRQFDLHVRSGGEALTLRLDRGRRLWGRVLEAVTEWPLPGAVVKASDVGEIEKLAVADGHGVYVLEGLQKSAPTVQVLVFAKGHGRLLVDVAFGGEEALEKDLLLDRSSRVRTRVLNSGGVPIAGVRGHVWGVPPRAPEMRLVVGSGSSDEAGELVIEDVEPAAGCTLVLRKIGYLEATSPTFDVRPAEELALEPLTLERGGAISGTVVGARGEPVVGASVTFARASDSEQAVTQNSSSVTDAHGFFRLEGLPSGVVDLVASAPRRLETRLPGVTVAAEQETANLLLRMEAAGFLAGRVVDESGAAIPEALLICRDYSSGLRELRSTAGPDGVFRVDGLASRTMVELEVQGPLHAPSILPGVSVGTSDLVVVLNELGSVAGIVVDLDGAPVAAFTVELSRSGAGTVRRSFASPRGEFLHESLVSGIYTGRVSAPGVGYAVIDETELREGQHVSLGRIVLRPDGVLRGSVVDSLSGQGIAGAEVHRIRGVRSLDEWITTGGKLEGDEVTLTASDGTFEFQGVPPVSHTLRALAAGYGDGLLSGVLPEGLPGAREAKIALDSKGGVTGTVSDSKGKPVPGISVYLMGSDPAANRVARADGSGAFSFEGVAPGRYTVKAHRFANQDAPGLAGEASVTIRLGGQAAVAIEVR